MENENEIIDSTIDTETTENEVVEDEFEETTPEIDVETLKKENATLKAQKEHWKKKAETKVEAPKSEGLKDDDVLYIAKSDIASEDLADLRNHMAKYGVGAKDAHEFLKPIFSVKEEHRKTAQLTQTKGGARAINKNTGEELWKKAKTTGQFPESQEELEKMLEAKYEERKSSLKK